MLIVDSQLAIAAGWEAHLSAARGVVALRVSACRGAHKMPVLGPRGAREM